MHHISADHHTKENGPKKELSILQDNLDYQVKRKYQDMCQEGYNTICCYFHPEYTHDLDPHDSGAGNHIRFWFVVYLDEWVLDYGNVEQCYFGLFPASD